MEALLLSKRQARKKAIDTVRDHGHETASDDRTHYFRMAARVYGLVLTDWGALTAYEYFRGGAPVSPLCDHVFRVNLARGARFAPLVDPMAPRLVREKHSESRTKEPHLLRDKTLVMAWDIETYDALRTGDLPLAKDANSRVFMICATFHWKDAPDALLKVCLVDVVPEPDARWTTVVCGTERGIIRAFALVYRCLAPDLVVGFNDGGYDWPFVIEKARQFRLLGFFVETVAALPRRETSEEDAETWNVWRNTRVKISAEDTAAVTFLKVSGSVPVDVRVMFRQLFPKAEVGAASSLDFYLRTCNLPAKSDLSYKEMWDIYARALGAPAAPSAQMRRVALYCVIDAQRCQELLVKRSVINDRREIAALSYVSLFDAVYYAGGRKVCNMVIVCDPPRLRLPEH